MPLDLSALDDAPLGAPSPSLSIEPAARVLTPPRAPLSAFEEDPDQPRTEFDDPEFEDFVKDIEERGVLQPIIVRVMSNGLLRIRFGARRYRASKRLALADLPYVVTEDARQFDDYAQVSENEQRKNLQPLELANFIAKRIAAGEKKKVVAGKLKIDASHVTHLLSLIDAPAFITELYQARKCRTPKYLYSLRKLHEQNPELVERRCAKTNNINSSFIESITKELAPVPVSLPPAANMEIPGNSKKPDNSGDSGERDLGQLQESDGPPADAGGAAVQHIPSHNPENEKEHSSPVDPTKLKKPLLLGAYDGREVMIVLSKRPSNAGLVFVRFEDGSGEVEVKIGDVSMSLLTDSTKA